MIDRRVSNEELIKQGQFKIDQMLVASKVFYSSLQTYFDRGAEKVKDEVIAKDELFQKSIAEWYTFIENSVKLKQIPTEINDRFLTINKKLQEFITHVSAKNTMMHEMAATDSRIIDVYSQLMQKNINEIKTDSKLSRYVIVVAICMAVILGAFFAWLTTLSILNPIKDVT